jgi:hypothetical protein
MISAFNRKISVSRIPKKSQSSKGNADRSPFFMPLDKSFQKNDSDDVETDKNLVQNNCLGYFVAQHAHGMGQSGQVP